MVCNIIVKEKWSITCKEVQNETESDTEIQTVINHLKNQEENKIDKKWKHEKLKLWLHDDGLLIKGHMIVLPRTLRLRAIRIAHATHMGKTSTISLLKQYVYWPGLTADVENVLNQCEECKIMRDHHQAAPMKRVEIPDGPWEHIAIDFYDAPSIGAKLLVVVDYFSRFLIVKEMKSGSEASKLIKVMRDIFQIYGKVCKIRSDNGQPMRSQEFGEWCEQMGIEQEFSAARHPQGNGMVERAMQGVKNALMYAQLKKINWREHIKLHETLYNNTPHSTTRISPNESHIGKKTDIGLPIRPGGSSIQLNIEKMKQKDRDSKARGKTYQDEYVKARNSNIQCGDLVWIKREQLKNKLDTPYMPEKYLVKTRIGNTVVLTDPKNPDQDGISRDVSKVLKCPSNAADRIRNEILNDIVTQNESNRTMINGLPIEFFHSEDISTILGTTTIIHQEVNKQIEEELNDEQTRNQKRSDDVLPKKRNAALKATKGLKEMIKNRVIKIKFIQTL